MFFTPPPVCPYGDCAICKAFATRPVPCTAEQRKQCCRTCSQLDDKLRSQAAEKTSQPPAALTTPASPDPGCEEGPDGAACGAGQAARDLALILLGGTLFAALAW